MLEAGLFEVPTAVVGMHDGLAISNFRRIGIYGHLQGIIQPLENGDMIQYGGLSPTATWDNTYRTHGNINNTGTATTPAVTTITTNQPIIAPACVYENGLMYILGIYNTRIICEIFDPVNKQILGRYSSDVVVPPIATGLNASTRAHYDPERNVIYARSWLSKIVAVFHIDTNTFTSMDMVNPAIPDLQEFVYHNDAFYFFSGWDVVNNHTHRLVYKYKFGVGNAIRWMYLTSDYTNVNQCSFMHEGKICLVYFTANGAGHLMHITNFDPEAKTVSRTKQTFLDKYTNAPVHGKLGNQIVFGGGTSRGVSAPSWTTMDRFLELYTFELQV